MPKTKRGGVPDERPNFLNRSALVIGLGVWKMRNGHIAEIKRRVDLPYTDSHGKPQVYPVWIGACVECGEPKSWNVNGTFSPVAKHENDIVSKVEK